MSSVLPAVVRGPFVPLGRAVNRRKDSDAAELEPLSVYLEAGVVPRASRDDNYNRLGADLSEYLIVQPGDVVFNKLRTWQGGFGVSKHAGIVSPAYYVCRPRADYEPRFLHYLLRSSPYLAELTRISKFMPPSQFDILWEDLRSVPIPKIALAVQRAIADLLDTETARIDALITKKRRLIELSGARYRSTLDQEFGCAPASAAVALGRFVVSLTQGVSPQASNLPAAGEEYGLLKLSAVKQGRYLPAENKALPAEFVVPPELVPRRGDLLVTRSNTPAYVGDVCVVDEETRVVLCDLIYRIRVEARLDPRFAALALLRSAARWHLSSAARGTSQSMVKLRGEDIKATRIPVPPLQCQHRIVEKAARAERRHLMLDERLRRQVELLQERRQALITAAVTGELEIPGVAA